MHTLPIRYSAWSVFTFGEYEGEINKQKGFTSELTCADDVHLKDPAKLGQLITINSFREAFV